MIGRDLPFFVSEVGSWWNARAQIDVVGVNRNERRVVLGEAKWLNGPMTGQHLAALMERGHLWLDGESGWDVHYALFSRSGFNQSIADIAENDPKVHLFTPESMLVSE